MNFTIIGTNKDIFLILSINIKLYISLSLKIMDGKSEIVWLGSLSCDTKIPTIAKVGLGSIHFLMSEIEMSKEWA